MRYDARILVTGTSGFIGTNFLESARSLGIATLGIDVSPLRDTALAPLARHVDLLDRPKLVQTIADFGPTHVVHLAARTDLNETAKLSGYAANIEGVENLLGALASHDIERLVVASSMLVCRNGYRPSDEYDVCPSTLYGESKVRTEGIVRSSGLPWVLVRPTSIWGPWFGTPYRDFFIMVARGRYMKAGDERTFKAMGYVGNVIQQLWALLEAPADHVVHRTFYVSDYEPYVLDEWADEVAAKMGRKPPPRVPLSLLRVAARVGDAFQYLGASAPLTSFRLENLLTRSSFDMTELSRIVGPLPYDRSSAVQRTVEWMRSSHLI